MALSVTLLACGESIDDESLDERISSLTEDGSEEDEDGSEEDEDDKVIPQSQRDASPPQLLAPQNDWEVTDYALSFTWERQAFDAEEDEEEQDSWSIDAYQLQVSRSSRFTNPVIDIVHKAPGEDKSRLELGDEEDEESLEIMGSLKFWTESVYMPEEVLETGEWFWRVRAADSDSRLWSEPIGFSIVSESLPLEPKRVLSPQAPLFSFDMYDSDGGGWGDSPPWNNYWDFFPDDIKPYVAFAVPHEGWGHSDSPSRTPTGEVRTYNEFLQPLADLEIPILIKTGGPDGDPQAYLSTAELEHLYQHHPNVLGVVTGENTWSHIDAATNPVIRDNEIKWFQNILRISGQYGKYVILGEGSYNFAWDKFLGLESPILFDSDSDPTGDYEWLDQELIKKYPDSFVPSSKSNIFWSQHQMDSAVFGASLSDLVTHHGMWAEAWFWSDAGYTNGVFDEYLAADEDADFSTMPHIFWIQTMLKTVASGGVVFHFGGESGVSENRGLYDRTLDAIVNEDGSLVTNDNDEITGDQYPSFWDMDGNKTLGFDRYIVPFIQAVIDHDLIPSKEDVLSEVKVAIDPGPVEQDKGNAVCYGHYAALYQNTYGIQKFYEDFGSDTEEGEIEEADTGCKFDLIPNNGRYYNIPVIPHPAESFDLSGIDLVPIGELQTEAAVRKVFDSYYPDRFTGDAWITTVGDSIFVTNSHENMNEEQSFGVSFNGPLQVFSGRVLPHAYIVASISDDRGQIWLQANAEIGPEYTDDRITFIEMNWETEPAISVSPSNALIQKVWENGKLSIQLSHQFGAVEAFISE